MIKRLSLPFKEAYEVTINDHAVSTSEIIYLNPFVTSHLTENPFKSESRQYPVDFGSPQEKFIHLQNYNT